MSASPMPSRRIHLTGASGSGVTTLGRALATRLALPHHDTDDYYWVPTVPPFEVKRAIPDRLRLMTEMFLPRRDWVLSGSLDGWGDPLIPLFDLVVFIVTPTEIRLARLRDREGRHFGQDALAPGGWRQESTDDFVAWAAHYDAGDLEGRSRARQEAWILALPCPVLRVDGARPIPDLVAEIVRHPSLDG